VIAYTESNFNKCLDVVSAIRRQRDEAIRIAEGMENLLEVQCGKHSFTECPCNICRYQKQLSNLKLHVISYQATLQKK